MAEVFAGCLLERLPQPRAATALPFFEFAPRDPLPKLATLARYQKQLNGRAKIALVAPRSTWRTPRGPMRPGPELDAGLDWLSRAADILDVFAIVLATGAELTTGERDSELLAAFIARLTPTGRQVIVAPRGLWDPEQAIPFAEKTGTIYGFDPLEHDAPPGPFVYGRVHPMGARPRLSEGHLAQIADRIALSGCEEAYVAIESERPLADLKRLTRAFAASLENAALEDLEAEDEGEDEDAEDEGEGDPSLVDAEDASDIDDEDEGDLDEQDEDEGEDEDEDEA
jgi:hypothetical protein